MTVFLVLCAVLAVFWLLGRLRLGALARYDEDGLRVRIIAGPLRLTLFPAKPRSEEEKARQREKKKRSQEKKARKKARDDAKKREKDAKWRQQHPEEEPEKKGGALLPVAKLLPLVAEAGGALRRRIRVDELTLHLTWASGDAMETALGYGRANAVMGMIWPLVDQNFTVKKHDLGVAVDFTADSPTIMCQAALTMRLGQLVSFALRLGSKFLVILLQSREKNRRREQ